MFNKKKHEFGKKVSVNFNTFQIIISEDAKHDEFIKGLKGLLEALPNVEEDYDTLPNGRSPITNKEADALYNAWMNSLSEASNVVMSILRKKPSSKRGYGAKSVYITSNEIKISE